MVVRSLLGDDGSRIMKKRASSLTHYLIYSYVFDEFLIELIGRVLFNSILSSVFRFVMLRFVILFWLFFICCICVSFGNFVFGVFLHFHFHFRLTCNENLVLFPLLGLGLWLLDIVIELWS